MLLGPVGPRAVTDRGMGPPRQKDTELLLESFPHHRKLDPEREIFLSFPNSRLPEGPSPEV